MDEVRIAPQSVDRFHDVLHADELARFRADLASARDVLDDGTVWHVNSTAEGGGVAEMLQSILGYPLDCGIKVRWVVIDGDDEFFELTKRLHHLLHGSPGDGGPLGPAEQRCYESSLQTQADEFLSLVRPGDAVILHDPQTLGLAPMLADTGTRVIWSCHIGADEPNEHTRAAWRFLLPYARHTVRQVFSRRAYGWEGLDPACLAVIPPCIDTFSAKNQELADDTIASILDRAAVIPDGTATGAPRFARRDETTGEVTSRAEMIEDEPVPPDAPIVTQISRWDPLKDHLGVLTAFCEHGPGDDGAHLVLAGPSPDSVSDDPEGEETFAGLRAAWSAVPAPRRQRVHIACLPMDDVDENAAIVNALQRRSDVVVQKSLAEGFGLTVAEAMWKARPTIGSRVGGIQDQIEPGVSGVLVESTDLAELGAAMTDLLRDREAARALGRAARARVCAEYLAPRHLDRYFRLLVDVLAGS
jgi:trehalose synthase